MENAVSGHRALLGGDIRLTVAGRISPAKIRQSGQAREQQRGQARGLF
jgi:hypothetical protein